MHIVLDDCNVDTNSIKWCMENTIPKEDTGTEKRAENQGTSAGNVFMDIAKPARLNTSPARRILFNIGSSIPLISR